MTINELQKLLSESKNQAAKALIHLEYSVAKVQKLKRLNFDNLEELESWEAFTSRFCRLSDILSKQILRSLILQGDPSFRGSLMDFLMAAEKLGYISSAERWWFIRSLRNKEAHEYTENDLEKFFQQIKNEASFLISEAKKIIALL